MMESLVENFKTGKMIQSNVSLATGIVVVLEKDAQWGGEVAKQVDKIKLKKEPTLNWDSNLCLECKQEQHKKVFKMHPANMKKFLLLNIGTVPRESSGDLPPLAWYCINLSNIRCEGDNWVVGTMGPNIKKMPPNSPFPSMCVSLGSVIYIIGNDDGEPSRSRMCYFDMSNPENEWLEGPSMNLYRERASAVVHDKKIYVFGGGEARYQKHCYGEVYDLVLNSWEFLCDPPENLDKLQSNFIGSYEDKKILVHPCSNETLYAYDVLDKSWEVLDCNFIGGQHQGVIMDNVLYVFDYWKVEIRGYDLVRSIWLEPINLDSPEWFPKTRNSRGMMLYEGFFFEVGANVLCLLYFDWMGREGLVIYCKTFTIKKTMQEDGNVLLETEVFSSTIYNLGEKGHCLKYVVM